MIYGLHSNSALGPQRNALIRGVPATIYDEEHSIELYSGRLAIDVFSDTFAHALAAAWRCAQSTRLAGQPKTFLHPPIAPACPARSARLRAAMNALPGHPARGERRRHRTARRLKLRRLRRQATAVRLPCRLGLVQAGAPVR